MKRLSRAAVDAILQRHVEEGLARAAVHEAAGAWSRARRGHRLHERVTGRDRAENRRIGKAFLKKIDSIVSYGALSSAEQAALRRTSVPLRATIESIFHTAPAVDGTPAVRAEGYRILAAFAKQLTAAGVSRGRAIEFIVGQLLIEVPPDSNPLWVYGFADDEADPHGALVARLTTFIKEQR